VSRRRKITVRVDGSLKLGMGHVMRCRRLAEYLEQHITLSPEILTLSGDEEIPNPKEYLLRHLATHPANLLVIDCNWADCPEMMESLPAGLPVVSLHEHNFPILTGVATAINPSLVEQKPPPGYKLGLTHFQGPDYLILDEQIPDLAKKQRAEMRNPAEIVICLGGADPDGYTLRVVDSLAGLTGIRLQVVIGPAFADEAVIKLPKNTSVILHGKPSRVAPILAEADIAITNAATTMFESIALGIPTIALPHNPYETRQAEICAKAGAAMAVDPQNIEDDVPALIEHLISDRILRQGLSSKGRSMIDGLGLSRVGNIIIEHLEALTE